MRGSRAGVPLAGRSVRPTGQRDAGSGGMDLRTPPVGGRRRTDYAGGVSLHLWSSSSSTMTTTFAVQRLFDGVGNEKSWTGSGKRANENCKKTNDD